MVVARQGSLVVVGNNVATSSKRMDRGRAKETGIYEYLRWVKQIGENQDRAGRMVVRRNLEYQ